MYRCISLIFLTLIVTTRAYQNSYKDETDSRKFASVSNELGDNLQRLLSSESGNQLISPYGISALLAALYQGATGNTRQQLDRIGYSALEEQGIDVSTSYQQLRRSLEQSVFEENFKEAIALLYPSSYSVLQKYQNILQSSYNALVQQVDYSQEDPTQEVNHWLQEKTNGKIPQIVDSLEASGLALLNGIYYQGALEIQSGSKQIKQCPFYNEGESSPQLVWSYQTQSKYPYYEDQQIQAVQLPYQDGEYSLIVVLPFQGNEIRQIQQQLAIHHIVNSFQEAEIKVTFPQFTLDSTRQFEEDIRSLGVSTLFGPDAELSGISEKGEAYVSQLAQRAVIELYEPEDEDGSASFSQEDDDEDEINFSSQNEDYDAELNVDHPFLFYVIQKSTGLNLLVGRVSYL